MKKMLILLALILCGVIALYAQSGQVRELAGTVELKRPGAADFVPAKSGDTLTQDTIVSTGFKSTALITVGGSAILVRPLTRLSLAELSVDSGSENINVNLQTGRIRVDVNPPAGTRTNMTVRGPSAIASVRGTGFDFDTRNLTVNHGKVSFQGNKGMVMIVGQGSASTVSDSGKAADPILITAGALLPPAPVGTGFVPAQKHLPAGAVFTVTLDYSSDE